MNYEEARNYLDQVSKGGSVLGLDNMRELLNRLEKSSGQAEIYSYCRNQWKRFCSGVSFYHSYRSGIPHRKIYFSGTFFLPGKNPGG